MTAAASAVAGAVLGALGPDAVRRIPERPANPGEEDDEPAGLHPEKVPYAELAAQPRLRWRLAAGSAVTAGLVGLSVGWQPALPAFVVAAVVGVWLAWVDVRQHLLPDWLSLPLRAAVLLLLLGAAAVSGSWPDMLRAVLGGLALWAFFLLLHLLQPRGMGYGDVKLAATLGLLLGWLGWGPLVVGAFLGFVLGGVGGLLLVLARRGGLKTQVPFGPYMLAGALLAVLWGRQLADAYVGSL